MSARRRRRRAQGRPATESGRLRENETPFEQSVEARLKDVERKMKGPGGHHHGYTAKLPRLMYSNIERYAPYLACLLDPWNHQAYIPDNGVYPSALRIVRSSGTAASDVSGNWELEVKPGLNNCFNMTGKSGTTYMDGTAHTSVSSITWDVHNYANLINEVASYRVVAMGIKLEYQGNLLNATGRAAVGLMPPKGSTITFPITEDAIADYTYSWIGTAVTPNCHVYIPTGAQCFDVYGGTDEWSTSVTPSFSIGYSGLPTAVEIIRWEVVCVLEIFSIDQMITPVKSGPSIYHPGSLDYQLHAARSLYEAGMTSHEGEEGKTAGVESGFFTKAGRWLKKNVLPAAKTAIEVGEAVAPLIGPLLI